jgi:hypothetical protein
MDEDPQRLAQRGSADPQNRGEFFLAGDAAAATKGARADFVAQCFDNPVDHIGPLTGRPKPHCHFRPEHRYLRL